MNASLRAEDNVLTRLYHSGLAATFSGGSLIFRSNKFPFPRQCACWDTRTLLPFTSGSCAAAGSAGRTKVTTSLPLPLHKIICSVVCRDQSLDVSYLHELSPYLSVQRWLNSVVPRRYTPPLSPPSDREEQEKEENLTYVSIFSSPAPCLSLFLPALLKSLCQTSHPPSVNEYSTTVLEAGCSPQASQYH